MDKKNESNWKKIVDNILIYNLYILIFGAIILATGFCLSINGQTYLFSIFQKLWYPIFIPSLSLFFTAILIESIIIQLIDNKK